MQINGVNEFLSRFTMRPDQIAAKNAANPLNPFLIKPDKDFLDLSEIGKRLSFRSEDVSLVNARAKTNGDKHLQLMDSSLSQVEATLEEMKELALAAANPNVTIADRLQMQIRMEHLRETLGKNTNAMSDKLAKMSGHEVPQIPLLENGMIAILERARERALRGEAWDVAEIKESLLEVRQVNIDGMVIEVEKGEWFSLPSDIDPEEIERIMLYVDNVESRWGVTDDKEIPTVRQLMEQIGTIDLTSVKSALKGVERIEKELNEIREMRKELSAFAEQYKPAPTSDTRDDNKMNEGEIAAMIGQIMKEEQARVEATRALMNPEKALVDGASVDKEEREESGSRPKIQVRTELGDMGDSGHGKLRLTRPTSPKGEMFAKIERLFDRIAGNLSSGAAMDAMGGKHAPVNYDWPLIPEETERKPLIVTMIDPSSFVSFDRNGVALRGLTA